MNGKHQMGDNSRGCHYCLCWTISLSQCKILYLSCSRRTAAGKISSCSSVPKTGVRLLAMALWDVARFLCAIRCASGWADLAIHICRCAARCWRWAAPQRPLASLYLPSNGSCTNWRSGRPDSPLPCNLSAPYCF